VDDDPYHDMDYSVPIDEDSGTKTFRCTKHGCEYEETYKRDFLKTPPPCIGNASHEFKYIDGSTDSRSEWTTEQHECTIEGCTVGMTIKKWHDEYGVHRRDIWYGW